MREREAWKCPLCGFTTCGSLASRSQHAARHRPWTSAGRKRPLLPKETFA